MDLLHNQYKVLALKFYFYQTLGPVLFSIDMFTFEEEVDMPPVTDFAIALSVLCPRVEGL